MPDWMDKAKDLAGEHADVVNKGLEQAPRHVFRPYLLV